MNNSFLQTPFLARSTKVTFTWLLDLTQIPPPPPIMNSISYCFFLCLCLIVRICQMFFVFSNMIKLFYLCILIHCTSVFELKPYFIIFLISNDWNIDLAFFILPACIHSVSRFEGNFCRWRHNFGMTDGGVSLRPK
jgi:hypothetical protein